ncbi:hypothetical protein H9P43_000148 [Blastocladiella emersonii ATCC 22665]|nr:hypothetical protein H9P43_000148 [Blastocladiella emersonii ATCC 22665]
MISKEALPESLATLSADTLAAICDVADSATAALAALLAAHPHLAEHATRRNASLAAALALAALAALKARRVYIDAFCVPPSLRRLPVLSPRELIKSFRAAGNGGTVAALNYQLARVREDAADRGIGMVAGSEVPRVWAQWIVGKWGVMVTSPEDIKLVFDKNEVFEKGKTGIAVEFLGRENVVNSQTPEWAHQRRIVNPAFHRGWPTELFGAPTRDTIAAWDAHARKGEPIEVTGWMERVALDALSAAAFGSSFASVRDPRSKPVVLYKQILKGLFDPVRATFPRLAWLVPSTWVYHWRMRKFNRFLLGMVDGRIAERKMVARAAAAHGGEDASSEKDTRPLLDLMIDAWLRSDSSFSREDLRANLAVFFLAGHDTTAHALAHALYLLGMHPAVQDRAFREVADVCGALDRNTPAADVTIPTQWDHAQLPLVDRIIMETLRLFPSVAVLPTRVVNAPVAYLADGTPLPRGIRVSVPLYHVHRSTELWGDDAAEFNPDRFLRKDQAGAPGQPGMRASEHAFAWAPFASGKRVCLGQTFATIEMRVVLAMLLLRYRWTTVGDEHALKGTPQYLAGILLQPKEIYIKAERRDV